MTVYPYKDLSNVRVMRLAGSTNPYPTGVALGHTSGPLAAGQAFSDTDSATESECIFVPPAGTSTPIYHAFLHRIITINSPAADERYRIDTPRIAGAGSVTWDAVVFNLPVIGTGGGTFELGIFLAGGFRAARTIASDGTYGLVYELIPVKS